MLESCSLALITETCTGEMSFFVFSSLKAATEIARHPPSASPFPICRLGPSVYANLGIEEVPPTKEVRLNVKHSQFHL